MKKIIFSFIFILFLNTSYALSEGVYTIIIEKQKEKEKSRWTLADWFETKKKIALMDQWLALNSSSTWVEIVLDYANKKIDETLSNTNSNTNDSTMKLGAALYIKFLGVEYNKYSTLINNSESDLRLNLLLLGSSIQSTHIRSFYGKRKYSHDKYSEYDQSFYGGAVNFYLARFLGLEYTYTKYEQKKSKNLLYQMHGEKNMYGVFIDSSFIRIYFNKTVERFIYTATSSRISKKDDGHELGIKFFF